MQVFGIDFTSRPRRGKPITCLPCRLQGERLVAGSLACWSDFASFESFLTQPGPWIAGLDFPFGQSRTFLTNIGWPMTWSGYVRHAETLGRTGFRQALDAYRAQRPAGDKEHRRATDQAAGAISPQKLHGTPVGLMFFEGAPRLLRAGVTIPGIHAGDPGRLCVEAYPGLLARALIGRRSYKQDDPKKQSPAREQARRELLTAILDGATRAAYGLTIEAPASLADDPSGDSLDALLSAIQAAWAWRQWADDLGQPAAPEATRSWSMSTIDPLEGWIADPHLVHGPPSPKSAAT
ncbi:MULTISPECIES: DUF429 domain-containing protein [Thiorhodovibrio]|uniref:DUF429 domain-containing protein n=1 Tax=Thiorhodovibrio TaxID=61593 RepID=UPI001912DFD0|nr:MULTISPECIES: DUF429 domain-containing protein [Thiorhodovibrio]MBK5969307.1 DUF429 domain-containing protein [Thiorhodovibrio winogradskyi]WPL11943.1 hypothetical protein Thiosp_01696 [Thiorhodovibrio litoralis]